MNTKVSIWVALLGCAGSAWLGAAVAPVREARAQAPADDKKPKSDEVPVEYPYLPARFGEPYIPSIADWQALRLTALGASPMRITEHFQRRHLTCFPGPEGLLLTLDLAPLQGWDFYAGGGKFSAPAAKVKPDIEKAVLASLRLVRSLFPEVRNEDMTIRVFLNNEAVGTWEKGKLTLLVEKPAA